MSGGGRRGAQRRAVEQLAVAYARLAKARAALARSSVIGQPPPATHPAYAALAAHRDRLLAVPGVVGVGLGLRARREPVLSVFVRSAGSSTRTWDDVTMFSAESRLGIGTEIVPFGDLVNRVSPTQAYDERMVVAPLNATAAASLAPGDGIGELAPASRGTLGVFGRMASGEAVGITAMHLVTASAVADGDPTIPLVQRDWLSTAGIAIGAIDAVHGSGSMRRGYGSRRRSRRIRISQR